jgi:hypothetical protein
MSAGQWCLFSAVVFFVVGLILSFIVGIKMWTSDAVKVLVPFILVCQAGWIGSLLVLVFIAARHI